jgi:hypothetical protein
MNEKHALAILQALAEWYEQGDGGPTAGSLLFDDTGTLKEHITAALGGISLESFAASHTDGFDRIPATKSKVS